MQDQESNAAARLRLEAFRILARKQTGLSIQLTEAERWLARFPTGLGDALDAFGVEAARKPASASGASNAVSTHRGTTEGAVRVRHDRAVMSSAPKGPPQDAARASLITVATLSITGVWSFLVAAIAVRTALMNVEDLSAASLSLILVGLGIVLGMRSASLVAAQTAVVSAVNRRGLQLLFALASLAVYGVANFVGSRQTGFGVEGLFKGYSLSIWLGVTLFAFVVVRRRRSVD